MLNKQILSVLALAAVIGAIVLVRSSGSGQKDFPIVNSVPVTSAEPSVPSIMTPAVISPALRGESAMNSLLFIQSTDLKRPAIKINLRAERKAELKQVSPTEYNLTIPSTRLLSPIFKAPQIAPEGFEPFANASVEEIVDPENPLALVVRIELSRSATLSVRQKGPDIEIVTEK